MAEYAARSRAMPYLRDSRGGDELDDLLTTNEVAHLTGAGATAVKRWADAGQLPCLRTGGGHRRFARSAVERFLRNRPAETIVEREPWVGALLEAGDQRALEALLMGERARTGAWHRVAVTVGEALTALGQLWQSGAVTIMEEHLASERLARALARVTEAMPLDPNAPRALLACAEGDDHTLGLALVELVLREAGWATLWAGRYTPTSALDALVRRGPVKMLALSASAFAADEAALRAQAEAVGRMCRVAGVSLALGGAGSWPDRPRYGVRFHDFDRFQAWAVAARRSLEG
jgi:excisionase family DNA binding protein